MKDWRLFQVLCTLGVSIYIATVLLCCSSGDHCIAIAYYTIIGGYIECRDCSQGAAQGSTGTLQDGSQTGEGDTISMQVCHQDTTNGFTNPLTYKLSLQLCILHFTIQIVHIFVSSRS